MSISYDKINRCFYLSGGNMTYLLNVDEQNRLMNLYWGCRIPDFSVAPDLSWIGDLASFDKRESKLPWEIPTRWAGWYGTPAVSVLNADGNDVMSLRYVSHTIYAGKETIDGLPATYTEKPDEADSLEILLRDNLTGLEVTVCYTVFAENGALTRSLRLWNTGTLDLRITGLLSASVPLPGNQYDVIHLKGSWSRERAICRCPVGEGEYRFFSQRGASGHEENPFIALCEPSATEYTGKVWAMNLVYSGSFLANAVVDNAENTRLSIGLNPDCFSWLLHPDDVFQGPEAVLVYSDSGLNEMSQIYHSLYQARLVRGVWRDRVRPVLINNWEGTYFDFDEEKILAIAEKAKKIGVELFVLDDGWFGKRNQDNCSLGDWTVNLKKLPHGMEGLSRRIHDLGLKFGLWFEPEMVSPDSDLYRAHPDWCLYAKSRPRTEARNQLILDLSRPEVQNYIIEAVSSVLENAGIDYVKWDMNRNMTEPFSGALEPERQGETQHRYMLGLYRVLETITSRFPNVLFESCSGGGGRFDAGMLYYMPQTWTSDNTDPVARLKIQYGTSLVYPISAHGAHVSASPNHQTGRVTGMEMRGQVAMAGNFGFELNMATLSEEELAVAADLVRQVKACRELTRKGKFYRLLSPFEGDWTAWQFVSEDKSETMICVYRVLNTSATYPVPIYPKGLKPDTLYVDEAGQPVLGSVLMNLGIRVPLNRDFTGRVLKFKRKHDTAGQSDANEIGC